MNVVYILTNEKHFPKSISQWGFDYGLFINLPRIIVACDFSPSSFKLGRGILPLLTKYVSQLKNCLSYQAKIFLWTKLVENLFLAKYLISVVAPLSRVSCKSFAKYYARNHVFLRSNFLLPGNRLDCRYCARFVANSVKW